MEVGHDAEVLGDAAQAAGARLEAGQSVGAAVVRAFLHAEVGGDVRQRNPAALRFQQHKDQFRLRGQAVEGGHLVRVLVDAQLQVEGHTVLEAAQMCSYSFPTASNATQYLPINRPNAASSGR